MFYSEQVIYRTKMTYPGDEVHHFGWNNCSSCYGDKTKKRDKLIIPCIGSDRVYILDVGENERAPQMFKVCKNYIYLILLVVGRETL